MVKDRYDYYVTPRRQNVALEHMPWYGEKPRSVRKFLRNSLLVILSVVTILSVHS